MVSNATTNKYAKTAIGAVVLMGIAAAVWPLVSSYGTSLNTSGIGLGSLFAGSLLGVIFGAAVFYAIYKGLM